LARVAVTCGRWQVIMTDAPEECGRQGDDQSAAHVDGLQCLAFCNALSEREGLTPYTASCHPMTVCCAVFPEVMVVCEQG
jgi:hypothetical protein